MQKTNLAQAEEQTKNAKNLIKKSEEALYKFMHVPEKVDRNYKPYVDAP